MKTNDAIRTQRVWVRREAAFQIQSKARAMGLHADVQNQQQAARAAAILGDEIPDRPPYLTGTDYASQPVLLTVECKRSQEAEVFGI